MNNERYNQIIDKAYKKYMKWAEEHSKTHLYEPYTHEQFIRKIKTDSEFSQKWGLKIEERELTLEERFNIRYPGGKFSAFQENYPNTHKRNDPNGLLDAFNIPTKLITTKYQNETIESYE